LGFIHEKTLIQKKERADHSMLDNETRLNISRKQVRVKELVKKHVVVDAGRVIRTYQ